MATKQPDRVEEKVKYAITVGPNRDKIPKHINPELIDTMESAIDHFKKNIPAGMAFSNNTTYAPNGPIEKYEIIIEGTTSEPLQLEMETLLKEFYNSLYLASYIHDRSDQRKAECELERNEFIAEGLGLEVILLEHVEELRKGSSPARKPGRGGGGDKQGWDR